MIFHENHLPADDSHVISFLICYFRKGGKIWNCRLLQIIGVALRVKQSSYILPTISLGLLVNKVIWCLLLNALIYLGRPFDFNCCRYVCLLHSVLSRVYEPQHEISNNVVCATSKGSDQPAHRHSLIRDFASRMNSIWVLSYWLYIIWSLSA